MKPIIYIASFLLVILFQQRAHAYLDPSSGSILIQIILGGIAGFFVLIKIYWRRIRRFLGFYGQDKSVAPAENPEGSNE